MSSPKASRVARTAAGMAPTCPGMSSAWATRRPPASVIAVEKSRLELRIWENEVRSIASPIAAADHARLVAVSRRTRSAAPGTARRSSFISERWSGRRDSDPRSYSAASTEKRPLSLRPKTSGK